MSVGAENAAQPLLWSVDDDRRLKDPERQLLDAIAAGDLDPHLVAIADAIHARRELLRTVAAATALAQLCLGDDVMFNHKVRPRYLIHEAATVVEIDDRSVAVRLWRPVGRFRDGLVRCPPLALHKLRDADTGGEHHRSVETRSKQQPPGLLTKPSGLPLFREEAELAATAAF